MNPVTLTLIAASTLILCAGAAADDAHIAGIDIGEAFESRVRSGIEQNRKSAATIRVVDKAGAPIAGARVTVHQLSHDFLFGCAFPMWTDVPERLGKEGWDNWNKYFTRLFNYTTAENALKWTPLEPEEGKLHWEGGDFMVKWCKERGITIKGHTLIWPTLDQGVPQWLKGYSSEKIAEAAKKHIDTVIGRYKSDIHIWDVVNEPIHLPWFEQHWGKDYVVESFKWARQADPQATLVINDFSGLIGDVHKFVPFVREQLAKGAPVDAIGEQAHDSPHWYNTEAIFATLDKMASTGLRIHLTEFTYPSNGSDITGGIVKGKWDERTQAEYYRYFFTCAFSHPNVDAITLWAMWDGSTWLSEGGIIRKDWTLKPSYEALDDLINSKWKTHFEAKSDASGEVSFRGFHGNYEVDVTVPGGKTRSGKFHVAKGIDNTLRFKISQ